MQRPPTMEDVARRAGVSRALVSLVMRDSPKVSTERRTAVLAAAADLGYRPNILARNLASHRTRTVGIMVNDLHNPYFADVIEGIEQVGSHRGYRTIINSGWRRDEGEEAAIETLLEFRTDGLVLAGPRLDERHIIGAANDVPVVAVGRAVDHPSVDTVNNDERVGARLVVEHLVGLGHERIVHVDGGGGAGAAARRMGYERAMRDFGLDRHIRVFPGDFTEASGVQAASAILATGDTPSAVFAANDLVAAGVLATFELHEIRVPHDVSVVGYDNTGLAAMQHMSLSTINQPRYEMGRIAMGALLERLEGTRTEPRHQVLAPTLMARSTSGPAS